MRVCVCVCACGRAVRVCFRVHVCIFLCWCVHARVCAFVCARAFVCVRKCHLAAFFHLCYYSIDKNRLSFLITEESPQVVASVYGFAVRILYSVWCECPRMLCYIFLRPFSLPIIIIQLVLSWLFCSSIFFLLFILSLLDVRAHTYLDIMDLLWRYLDVLPLFDARSAGSESTISRMGSPYVPTLTRVIARHN